jgi:hypothetical protein
VEGPILPGPGTFADQRLFAYQLPIPIDESSGRVITLRAPFILLDEGAIDHVKIDIEPRMLDEVTNDRAKKRRDRQRILDVRADIGDAQLERQRPAGTVQDQLGIRGLRRNSRRRVGHQGR